MRVTKVFYKKKFALPNFENHDIGIEVDVDYGEEPQAVLNAAKAFVERNR